MSTALKASPANKGSKKARLKKGCAYVLARLEESPEMTPQKHSLCVKVAHNLGLPVTSLYSKVNRALEPKEKDHGNNLLTRAQEVQLVGFALALRQLGEPKTGREVCHRIHLRLL